MHLSRVTGTARWTLALNPAVGATAHESGDGRKHTRLLGSTRESSTVLVLEAPNKPLAPLPPGCLPDGGHPSPVGPLLPHADMPRSSQDLKVPNAGPDPQRTTIQGPIVSSYSSKLSTDDVTPKSP